MLDEYYDVKFVDGYTTFEFLSNGLKGSVAKVVMYTKISSGNVYNLGFGDKDPMTGELNDTIVTNNGDSKKVLATVATTLFIFMSYYTSASVIAIGSTDSRTRLYRIGITSNLEMIQKKFEVFGLVKNNWEAFTKNENYDAFLVRLKL